MPLDLLLYIVPLLFLLGSILYGADDWKVVAFIGVLWFVLLERKGHVYVALLLFCLYVALWIYLPIYGMPLALLPLLLAGMLLPGRRRQKRAADKNVSVVDYPPPRTTGF